MGEAVKYTKLSAREDALQRRLAALLMKLRESEIAMRECLDECERRESAQAQHG